MISSLDNPKVKLIQKLRDRKKRERESKFVIEGVHLVLEALKCFKKTKKFFIEYILYSRRLDKIKDARKLLEDLRNSDVELFQVPERIINSVTDVESSQGIIGVIREEKFNLNDVIKAGRNIVVMLIGVQDPGNLGTIIRTADAVGASGVILSRGTVDPYNSKVLRASMGSIFHLPVVKVENTVDAIDKLKQNGFKITAAVLDAKESIFDVTFEEKQAFLFGSEGEGLPEEVIKLSHRKVRIPMPGDAESLNVGVSSAVMLYEALRQFVKGDN